MDFTKEKCVVCDKYFGEEDDVVVCPECGSPYHRECYNIAGHCINEARHNEGFSYERHEKSEKISDKDEENKNEKSKAQSSAFGYENDIYEDEEINKQIKEDEEKRKALFEELTGENVIKEINGKSSIYYGAAVAKNQQYYIPRFVYLEKAGKKSMFNFTAFLFPLGWTLYRKIYKLAAAVLAFYLVIAGISTVPVATNEAFWDSCKEVVETEGEDGIYNVLMYSYGMSESLTPAEAKLYDSLISTALPTSVSTFLSIMCIIFRYVVGMFATGVYFEKTKNLVEKTVPNGDYLKERDEQYEIVLLKKGLPLPLIVAALGGIIDMLLLF